MIPQKIEFTSSVDGLKDWYMLHDAGANSMCLVYLHGHGSHGDQPFTRQDIAANLPLIERLNLSVISPNLRDNAWMNSAAVEDLRYILQKHKTENKFSKYIIVSGSMGGTGALIFAVRHPELVSALGIMGGATDIRRYIKFCRQGDLPVHQRIADAIENNYSEEDYTLNDVCGNASKLTMPLYFYHGEADTIMPVTEMQALQNILAAKENAEFKSIPGGDHDSPLPFMGELICKTSGLKDFSSVYLRGTATAASDTIMSGSTYKYNWYRYLQGQSFETSPAGTPECINHACALSYALERLSLDFPEDQLFFGGQEQYMLHELPENISEEEFQAKARICVAHGLRNFVVGWDHTAPDYSTLLQIGLGGYLQRAGESVAMHGTPESKAMLKSLEALSGFFVRAADHWQEKRPEAAERLRRMATEPPQDFGDALQLVWLVFVVLASEGRYHNALARLDQYLLPFHKPENTTQELNQLCHIFSKIEDYHQIINICIGGVTPAGDDATNDLSYMILDAVRIIHSSSTNLSARLHNGTPDKFLRACVELIATGIGFPAVMNDEVYIPALTQTGIPLEAARDYALFGCVEGAIPGRQQAWSDSRFALPEKFLATVKRLEEFATPEELWNAFAAEVQKGLTEHLANYNDLLLAAPPDKFPDPLLSALTRDCIARGLDINGGGAEFPRIHGVGMVGIATVADSFAAIKKLVFEEKRIAPKALLKALDEDFANDEIMRQMLINCAPKYGNDSDYVDYITADLIKLCSECCAAMKTVDGGRMLSCMASNVSNIFVGQELPATPDGRHAGEPLSDAASPAAGKDVNGPTAFLNSIVKPDYSAQNCTVVNMRFLPEMFDSEEGKLRMMTLLRKFIAEKGHEMQFNVTSNAQLEDAIAHPENYGDLMVRVSGFSAFFTKLLPEIQKDILRRNSHA